MSESKINTPQSGHDGDEETPSAEEENQGYSSNRRTFLKGVGTAAGAAAVGVHPDSPLAAVEGAEALSVPDVSLSDIEIDRGDLATSAMFAAAPLAGVAYYGVQELLDSGSSSGTELHDAIYSDSTLAAIDVRRTIDDIYDEISQTSAIARSQGKVTAAKAYNNGLSKSKAKTKATDKVKEFFAGTQEEFAKAQGLAMRQLEQWIVQEIGNDSNVTVNDVFTIWDDYDATEDSGATIDNVKFSDVTFKLMNGKEITVRRAALYYTDSGGAAQSQDLFFYGDGQIVEGGSSKALGAVPSSTYSASDIVQVTTGTGQSSESGGTLTYSGVNASWYDVWNSIISAKDSAVTDVKTIVDDIYANYDGSNTDVVEEVTGSTDRLLDSGTNFITSGAPEYAQYVAYENGYNTTDPSTTLTVDYTPNSSAPSDHPNGELSGSIRTQFDPSDGSYDVGDKFDTANISNAVYFIYVLSDGSVEEIEMSGTFEVLDVSGDSNSIGTYNPQHTTTDVSNLINQFERLLKDRKAYDKSFPTTSGVGGGGFFSGNKGVVAVILSILGIAGYQKYQENK